MSANQFSTHDGIFLHIDDWPGKILSEAVFKSNFTKSVGAPLMVLPVRSSTNYGRLVKQDFPFINQFRLLNSACHFKVFCHYILHYRLQHFPYNWSYSHRLVVHYFLSLSSWRVGLHLLRFNPLEQFLNLRNFIYHLPVFIVAASFKIQGTHH